MTKAVFNRSMRFLIGTFSLVSIATFANDPKESPFIDKFNGEWMSPIHQKILNIDKEHAYYGSRNSNNHDKTFTLLYAQNLSNSPYVTYELVNSADHKSTGLAVRINKSISGMIELGHINGDKFTKIDKFLGNSFIKDITTAEFPTSPDNLFLGAWRTTNGACPDKWEFPNGCSLGIWYNDIFNENWISVPAEGSVFCRGYGAIVPEHVGNINRWNYVSSDCGVKITPKRIYDPETKQTRIGFFTSGNPGSVFYELFDQMDVLYKN